MQKGLEEAMKQTSTLKWERVWAAVFGLLIIGLGVFLMGTVAGSPRHPLAELYYSLAIVFMVLGALIIIIGALIIFRSRRSKGSSNVCRMKKPSNLCSLIIAEYAESQQLNA